MRSLIKAVDDYVSDNYNTIVAGNAVNNSVNNSVNYSDLVSGGKVTVNGVQGIWAIDNMSSELGVTTTNGSIVTSSVQPITEAGGGGNNENYLYRIDMSGRSEEHTSELQSR